MEPLLSKEEREKFLEEREERLRRNYRRGKVIVSVISVTYILFTVFSSIIRLNVLGLLINISAAVALWFGVKWVRVYYAAAVALSTVIFIVLLFNPGYLYVVPGWIVVANVVQIIFGIISTILLFKHEGVIDFMEYQREAVN